MVGDAVAERLHIAGLLLDGDQFLCLAGRCKGETGRHTHVVECHVALRQTVVAGNTPLDEYQFMMERKRYLLERSLGPNRARCHQINGLLRRIVLQRRRIGVFDIGIIGINVQHLTVSRRIGFRPLLFPRTVVLPDELGILNVISRSPRIRLNGCIGTEHGEKTDCIARLERSLVSRIGRRSRIGDRRIHTKRRIRRRHPPIGEVIYFPPPLWQDAATTSPSNDIAADRSRQFRVEKMFPIM